MTISRPTSSPAAGGAKIERGSRRGGHVIHRSVHADATRRCRRIAGTARSSAPCAAQLLRLVISSVSCGATCEQVADDAEVGELEDRRLGVLVDRDDRLGRLHAGAVLDGAGDADRDVELRRHGHAGLADLHGVRHPAGVDDGARGADGRAERVGQLLDDREVVGLADAATAGDDDRGVGQLRARALRLDHRVDDLGAPWRRRTASPTPATSSAAPVDGSGANEFGRTVMTGVPVADLRTAR